MSREIKIYLVRICPFFTENPVCEVQYLHGDLLSFSNSIMGRGTCICFTGNPLFIGKLIDASGNITGNLSDLKIVQPPFLYVHITGNSDVTDVFLT
jgi:hypothetical protein